MEISVREVKSRKELRAYIQLPGKIHKGHTNWVPPIYMDEREYYNPKKNENFAHCDTILYLAYKEKKVVGRIMGVIHHQYNERENIKVARFNYLEVYNDQEVASVLLNAVEAWGRKAGMERLIGPFAFSDKDPQGYLTEGFDKPQVIASHCNYPYLIDLIENEGYSKEVDLVAYKLDIPEEDPEIYKRISERTIKNNPDLKLLEYTRKKDLRTMIVPVLELLNRTFIEIYGFAALTEKEMKNFANRYLIFINPRLVKVIVNSDNEPVAFVIGMEEIGKGIQRCKGRVLPFGIFKIFKEARRSKQLTLLLAGIEDEYRGRGLDSLMGLKMLASARYLGKEFIDSHLELESNMPVRSEMEKMGGVVYKKFRVFQKAL